MREAREDPNLAEVKAVLKKLQRLDVSGEVQPSPEEISAIPSRDVPPAPLRSVPSSGAGDQPLGIFERKQAAFDVRSAGPRFSQRRLLYAAAGIILFAGAGVLVGFLLQAPTSSANIAREGARPALDRKDESILLIEARRLIGDGDVTSARKRLLHGGPDVRADLAFLLAQTFDPNYLRSLPASNSLPDRAEAERWYKKWYELAVNSGLEMDSGRLQRIIKAMR